MMSPELRHRVLEVKEARPETALSGRTSGLPVQPPDLTSVRRRDRKSFALDV